MESISNEFPISLRSWPTSGHDPSALPTLIQRINFERGGFLNITEESLRQEIAEEEANGMDNDESSSSDEEEEPDKLKELMMAREELLREIEQAHQSALYALDFISLLLTKDVAVDISPLLTDLVGPKTLGTDKVAASKLTEAQKLDDKQIAKGWKAQSLNKAIDSIQASAERLEKEIEHETKYWEQVLAVSDNGWAVCRLPNEKHILGVRYGFSEASSAFKTRSLAVLQRNPDGGISLDQGMSETAPKTLRARIQVNGKDTGITPVPNPAPKDAPIETLILQARNTIFAEELWQELNREARSFAPVQDNDDCLVCPLTANKTMILELVTLGEPQPPTSSADNDIAEAIYLALHLLLSYSHRGNYRRRTQARKPISPSSMVEPAQTVTLVRGILTRLTYQESIKQLYSLLDPLCLVLNKASIPASYTRVPTTSTPPSHLSNAEKTIMTLMERLEARFALSITSSTTLNIQLRTFLSPLCSAFFVSLPNPTDPVVVTAPPFNEGYSSFEALRDYVLQATACALAAGLTPSLVQLPPPPPPVNDGEDKMALDSANNNEKETESQKVKEDKKWIQTGQFTLLSNVENQKQLSISVHAERSRDPKVRKPGVSLQLVWDGPRSQIPEDDEAAGKRRSSSLSLGGEGLVRMGDSEAGKRMMEKSGKRGEKAYVWVAWENEKQNAWGEDEGEVVNSFEDVVKDVEKSS